MQVMEGTTRWVTPSVYRPTEVWAAWDLPYDVLYNPGDILKFRLYVGNNELVTVHWYWMGALFYVKADGTVGDQIYLKLFGLWQPEGLDYLVNDPDVTDGFFMQPGITGHQDVRVAFTRSNMFMALYMFKMSPQSPTVDDEIYGSSLVKLIPAVPDGNGDGNGGEPEDLSGMMEAVIMIMMMSMMMGMVRG